MPSRYVQARPYSGKLDAATLLFGPVTMKLAELGLPLDADLLDPEGDFNSPKISASRFLKCKSDT